MKTSVYCVEKTYGILTFYLKQGRNDYFLFNQNFKSGVYDFYSKGVILDKAMQMSLARHDYGILKTMEKLPIYIKYVEMEENIFVLRNTIEKAA